MSPTTPILRDISPELVLVDPELRAVVLQQLPEPGMLGRVSSPTFGPNALVEAREPPAVASDDQTLRPRGRLARRVLLTVAAASLTANVIILAGSLSDAGPAPTDFPTGAPTTVTAVRTAAVSAEKRPRQRSKVVGGVAASHARTSARPSTSAPQRTRTLTATPGLSGRPAVAPQSRSTVSARRAGRAITTHITAAERPTLSWKPVKRASYYNLVLWRSHQRLLDLWPASTHVLLPRTWTHAGVTGSLSPGRYLWFVYPGFGARASARYGKPVQSGILIVNQTKGSQ